VRRTAAGVEILIATDEDKTDLKYFYLTVDSTFQIIFSEAPPKHRSVFYLREMHHRS
jgi:hypothetical protein